MATVDAGTVTLRRATPADGAAMCELFARVPMETELALSIRRDSDFSALLRLQSDDWECWVAEEEGRVEAMASLVFRDGYLGGEIRRVGYLGDLRLSPRVQGRHLLNRVYGPTLSERARARGCAASLTAVIASNQRALRALTARNRRQRGMPRYTPLRDFRIRNVHLALPRLPRRGAFRVRRATEADLPALAAFLDADARRRPFGTPMPLAELRRRLAEWPGLSVDSFYLAEDGDGALAGCLAVWDAAPVKRTVVAGYRGKMRRIKTGYDLAARLLRFPRLPDPGEELRYLYATHQAIPSEDPAVLRALLERVYADHRRSGYVLLSFFVPENDPMEVAFRGFQFTDLPARLFVVTPPGTEPPPECLAAGRPGFEMALV
ncbi:MAG: GNAT family N-acetyltransferase [Gemmatimonadetes bacterium]|nr:GNAT family N-acetyltransferase [Gemmatimonadota bacterium]